MPASAGEDSRITFSLVAFWRQRSTNTHHHVEDDLLLHVSEVVGAGEAHVDVQALFAWQEAHGKTAGSATGRRARATGAATAGAGGPASILQKRLRGICAITGRWTGVAATGRTALSRKPQWDQWEITLERCVDFRTVANFGRCVTASVTPERLDWSWLFICEPGRRRKRASSLLLVVKQCAIM